MTYTQAIQKWNKPVYTNASNYKLLYMHSSAKYAILSNTMVAKLKETSYTIIKG